MLRDYLRESRLADSLGGPQDAVFSWIEIRPPSGSDLRLKALKCICGTSGADFTTCGFEHRKRPWQRYLTLESSLAGELAKRYGVPMGSVETVNVVNV